MEFNCSAAFIQVASWGGRSALTELDGHAAVVMTLQLRRAALYAWEWRCVDPRGEALAPHTDLHHPSVPTSAQA